MLINMNEELEKVIEEKDKLLLASENIIGYASIIAYLSSMYAINSKELSKLVKAIFIVSGTTILLVGASFAIKLEQKAGYYKCSKCDDTYVPENYLKVFFAPHIGKTRYMKCDNCEKYSWNKKVLTKKK